MKKIKAMLLAVLMLLNVSSLNVYATETYNYGDYSYNLINGNAVLFKYNGSDTEVVIPGYIDGYPVEIGNSLFEESSITKAVIEKGVTVIGAKAFDCCRQLKEVILPEGVKEIKERAFQLSALKEISLPDSLEIIGKNAFCQSYVVTTIPKNVKSIGEYAFKTWSQSIDVDEDNPYFSSKDGALYNKDFTTLLQVPYWLVKTPENKLILPDTVKTIASHALEDCIVVPVLNEGLEVIEDWGIYNTNNGLVIPSTVKKIGMMNFNTKTKEITVLSMDCEIGTPNLENIIINCYPGSTVEQAAKEAGATVKLLEEPGNHKHNYSAQVFNVSCTEDGYTLYTCRCGDSYTDSRIPATGHSYNESVTVKPTCTEKGSAVYTCTVCGDTYEKQLDALGHKYKFSAEKQATFNKNGYESKICTVCGDIAEGRIIPALDSVKLAKASLTYTGKALTSQGVTVKDVKGNTVANDNYTLTYFSRANGKAVSFPKAVGQYKASVVFKENYSGERTFYFSVMPKKVKLKKPKLSEKAITVKWKKSRGISGYQITLATNKRFTKGVKTVTVKAGKSAYKFKKLKSGKKYYVRIRSYKSTKVDGRSAKMYSPFSKLKLIKCK